MEFNNTTQTYPPQDRVPHQQLQKLKVYNIIMPTIILIGFVGNALILVVMCSRKFDKTSTSIYLTVLAVGDSLFLFAGPLMDILPSAFGLDIDLRTIDISACWILKFLIYWARHMSSVCLISITLERLIAVLIPHK